jgi:hypothetical protein
VALPPLTIRVPIGNTGGLTGELLPRQEGLAELAVADSGRPVLPTTTRA